MKRNLFKRMCALALCLCLLMTLSACSPESEYQKASQLLAAGKYTKAAEKFAAMGSYSDAPLMALYAKASAAGESGQYDACLQALEALDQFRDSQSLINYYTARSCEASGLSVQIPQQQAELRPWQDLIYAANLYGQHLMLRDSLQRQQSCYQAAYDMAEGLAAADHFHAASEAHERLAVYGYKDSQLLADYYAARACEAEAPKYASYSEQWNAADFNKYALAIEYYQQASLLRDSQQRAEACSQTVYNAAMECAAHGDYTKAIAIIGYVPGYLDAASLKVYYSGCHEESLGHYATAAMHFDTLGDYTPTGGESASLRAENARMTGYTTATAWLEEGRYADGYALLRTLGSYNNAAAYVPQHEMQRAEAHLAAGEYTAAIDLFTQIRQTAESGLRPEYTAELGKAAGLRADHALYCYGEELFANAHTTVDYSLARAAFEDAGDYAPEGSLPASQRYQALWYARGEELLMQEQPDYDGAKTAFEYAGDYAPEGGVDAATRVKETMYLKGEMYLTQALPNYTAAKAAFVSAMDYAPEGGVDAATRVLECWYLIGEDLLAQEQPDYNAAKAAFTSAGDYAPEGGVDAATRVLECWYLIGEDLLAQEKPDYDAAIEAFTSAGDYAPEGGVDAATMVKEIQRRKSGTGALAAGYYHTVALKTDGTVVATGRNDSGQCDVDGWTDIVAVAAGSSHTVGLKRDGTVVAKGSNAYGQCALRWENITAIAAGPKHTVGLKADGTVVASGINNNGQCNVDGWTDIVAVAAGSSHTVGLKRDGTVVAKGSNSFEQCDVSSWRNITAIAAGPNYTMGLKTDGTVEFAGSDRGNLSVIKNWTDIIAIAAGTTHAVGLKADGTVVAVGSNSYGQCGVSSWTGIVAIAAGNNHTVGLKADGTVVAVSSNSPPQCDVSSWTNIGPNAADPTTGGHAPENTVVASSTVAAASESSENNPPPQSDLGFIRCGILFGDSQQTVSLKETASLYKEQVDGVSAVWTADTSLFGLSNSSVSYLFGKDGKLFEIYDYFADKASISKGKSNYATVQSALEDAMGAPLPKDRHVALATPGFDVDDYVSTMKKHGAKISITERNMWIVEWGDYTVTVDHVGVSVTGSDLYKHYLFAVAQEK